jgi:hypothetical protein
MTPTEKAAEDARFREWLLNRKGCTLTMVRTDGAWNRAVARVVTDQLTGNTKI